MLSPVWGMVTGGCGVAVTTGAGVAVGAAVAVGFGSAVAAGAAGAGVGASVGAGVAVGLTTSAARASSMAFAMADSLAVKGVAFEPYTATSGISTAANLREALRSSALLGRECARAQVLIDAPALLVPIEEYDEATADAFYRYTLVTPATSVVMSSVVPTLNSVALFGVNRDLRQVIDDRYADVRYMPVEQPVWSYLHRRSFSDTCHRL